MPETCEHCSETMSAAPTKGDDEMHTLTTTLGSDRKRRSAPPPPAKIFSLKVFYQVRKIFSVPFFLQILLGAVVSDFFNLKNIFVVIKAEALRQNAFQSVRKSFYLRKTIHFPSRRRTQVFSRKRDTGVSETSLNTLITNTVCTINKFQQYEKVSHDEKSYLESHLESVRKHPF